MPNSLMDMFQPRDAMGQPTDFAGALGGHSNSLIGLGMGMLQPRSLAHGAPVSSAWSDALQGYQAGSVMDQRRNQAQAQLAHQKQQLAQQEKLGMLTGDIKEFQYAKNGGYKGSFQDWQKQQQQLQNKASMTPTYYYEKDENGKDVLKVGQLQSGGGLRPLDIRPAETQGRIDTGTGTQLYGTRTGQPPPTFTPNAPSATPVEPSLTAPTPMSQNAPGGFFPKDVRTPAQEKELGKKTGAAQFDLPRVENETNQTLEVIDQLRNHPGKNSAIGAVAGRLPALGGDQAAFINYLKQAEGKAFIQSYQMLKGGGAITEIEGAKATAALARLQRVTTLAEFDKALNDFESAVKSGYQKIRQQAGQGGNDGGSQPRRLKFNPATGDFE